MCDLFYALMALPTMITLLVLSGRVRDATRRYFSSSDSQSGSSSPQNN